MSLKLSRNTKEHLCSLVILTLSRWFYFRHLPALSIFNYKKWWLFLLGSWNKSWKERQKITQYNSPYIGSPRGPKPNFIYLSFLAFSMCSINVLWIDWKSWPLTTYPLKIFQGDPHALYHGKKGPQALTQQMKNQSQCWNCCKVALTQGNSKYLAVLQGNSFV